MSRRNGTLYFAPSVSFKDVDLKGNDLPRQIFLRVYGYYVEPAIMLAKKDQAFAAGLLCVCAMEHMGYLLTGAEGSQARFMECCRLIPDLKDGDTPEDFYKDFRCGLVHAARIENAGEFDLDAEKLASRVESRLIVNPLLLAQELVPALKKCIGNIYKEGKAKSVASNIRKMFKAELGD